MSGPDVSPSAQSRNSRADPFLIPTWISSKTDINALKSPDSALCLVQTLAQDLLLSIFCGMPFAFRICVAIERVSKTDQGLLGGRSKFRSHGFDPGSRLKSFVSRSAPRQTPPRGSPSSPPERPKVACHACPMGPRRRERQRSASSKRAKSRGLTACSCSSFVMPRLWL